ncbi:MAG: tyrosine-type recombinase/integrase [Candidatus Nitrosotenuis sp.]
MESQTLIQGQHECVLKTTSFLLVKKTKKGYLEKISTEPAGTQHNRIYAIQNLEKFILAEYAKTVENVVDELHWIKKQDEDQYFDSLYDLLQKWINWNEKTAIGNYTIRALFSNVRKYLYYLGIKTDIQDIKENLRFGKKVQEERHPLSQKEYRAIIDGFATNPRRQALFLALGSSGMRIGEALRLRKKDLDLTTKRIKVNISAESKTKQGRSTFISKEAEEKLRPILAKLHPNDLVFSRSGGVADPVNECAALKMLLKKLGMDERYDSNQHHKITTHSFRAYFFTKAARKHGENYAHRMTGHGGYLIQYDRITEDEKLNMYLELEPDLMIYDQTKNELEITRLKKENEIIGELQAQINKLKDEQTNQEKVFLDKLRKEGIIQ